MLEEFRKFALRGNVVDLAIGVIIGAAFGAIVQSVVGDILMPIIGAATGGLDFSNYFIGLSSKVTAAALVDAKKQGAVLAWGNFLTIVINFLIIASVLFLVIRALAKLQKTEAAKSALPPKPSRTKVAPSPQTPGREAKMNCTGPSASSTRRVSDCAPAGAQAEPLFRFRSQLNGYARHGIPSAAPLQTYRDYTAAEVEPSRPSCYWPGAAPTCRCAGARRLEATIAGVALPRVIFPHPDHCIPHTTGCACGR